MDASTWHGRVQVYVAGLRGPAIPDPPSRSTDPCEPTRTRYFIPLLPEEQGCILRQEIARYHPERKLRGDGHLW